MAQSLNWLSFHIYLGEYRDRSDWIVREALPAIAADTDWFYLNYTDGIGEHIRFRLRGPSVDADSVEDQLSQVASELPGREKSVVGPLVTIVGMPRSVPSGPTGVRAEQYSRDLQKYRTELIAELAEQGFVASTELAVSIFAEEYAERVPRKSLAPNILWALVQLLPNEERSGFLDAYADFTLRSVDATALKENFVNTGMTTKVKGTQVFLEDDAVPQAIHSRLDTWIQITAALLDAACQEDERDGASFRNMLLMDAMHLNNNRLGFNFIDEAYLAILVKTQLNEAGQRHV